MPRWRLENGKNKALLGIIKLVAEIIQTARKLLVKILV